MKLSQREIDLLKLALDGEEETTVPQLKKTIEALSPSNSLCY